jgi:hypothetical protein
MRPATAAAIAAIEVPWDELYRIGELHPPPDDHPDRDYIGVSGLEWGASGHLSAVADAAARGRGVIGLITF